MFLVLGPCFSAVEVKEGQLHYTSSISWIAGCLYVARLLCGASEVLDWISRYELQFFLLRTPLRDIVLPRYLQRVNVFQLCAIDGDGQLTKDNVLSRLGKDFCLPEADEAYTFG